MRGKVRPSEEQLVYAYVLDRGMKIGLVFLTLTFLVYIFKLFPPHIPIEKLPSLWGLNVHQYLKTTNIQRGWTWIYNLNKGDFLNFLPVAFLAGLTILCYLRMLFIYIKKKDIIYSLLVFLQIIILLVAASGILKVGGH
ncbi:MAG: hypothetical protein N2327_04365 [Caldimicrobium sp.]|nr:hypothetical protein [Caldimicrobium sp.]MCX7873647.1 hypothetical protein [Caldimicrobium sp.]MDW8094338.1 hypothetical protein [Caldimicrobium sp.]